jgi:hypothetical protein
MNEIISRREKINPLPGYFYVRKINGRLKILECEEVIYVPPDFLRKKMSSRKELQELAERLSLKGRRDIDKIIDFERAILNLVF